MPEVVTKVTAAYRDECDELGGFFDDRCEFGPEYQALAATLREGCEAWCKANGMHAPDSCALAAALTIRGCKSGKVGGNRGWHGVRVKPIGQASEDR